ncbi:cx9C motif-containing protein 4 [Tribolium madens]|uniref:cx9C motif-containing protein 4 n=1 Tax=Tribolium madens TaxID=41895 RepID=UPI001CF74BDD|nr:cx9C motif-containing protein 4 [Tribolium madens]
MPKKDPCKVFACRIQKCLEDNKFQESACQYAIEDLHNCCRKWKNQSLVCDGIKIAPTPKA